MTIPKKWRSAWLTGPLVRDIFPEHSFKSWAPERDQVVAWLCQKYPTAHSGAEQQAEHHKLCSHNQKRLCYLRMLGTPSCTSRESRPSGGQVPAAWVHQPGNATQAYLHCNLLCPTDRIPVSKNSLHKHSSAFICTEELPQSPSWLVTPCQSTRCYCPTVSLLLSEQLGESPERLSLNKKSAPVTEIFSKTQHDNYWCQLPWTINILNYFGTMESCGREREKEQDRNSWHGSEEHFAYKSLPCTLPSLPSLLPVPRLLH